MILSLFSAASAAALASPLTLVCSWFGSDCVWLSILSFPFLKAVTVVPLLHLGTIRLSQKITEMHGFALKIWADAMTWHSRPFRVFFLLLSVFSAACLASFSGWFGPEVSAGVDWSITEGPSARRLFVIPHRVHLPARLHLWLGRQFPREAGIQWDEPEQTFQENRLR